MAKIVTLLFIDMGPKGSEKSIIVQWNKVQGMWICVEFYVNFCSQIVLVFFDKVNALRTMPISLTGF